MKKIFIVLIINVFLFSIVNGQNFDKAGQQVTLKTKDGITLYADLYVSAKGKTAPLIMLFHQGGGDARGEYSNLIPKLRKKNYNLIAVDLRTGGSVFESENRTVKNLGDKKFGYCDAYPDLEATLEYVKKEDFTGKNFAWGSSFSAALVFQLADKHAEKLAGILAFSPASGGPMVDCKPDLFVENLKVPALALRPRAEMERETSQKQFELFQKHKIQTYVSEDGVHGSSMLDPKRVEGSVEDHWKAVLKFIKKNS